MHDLHQQKISKHPHPTAQALRAPQEGSATLPKTKCRPFKNPFRRSCRYLNRVPYQEYRNTTTHLCYPPLRSRYHGYRPGTPRLLRGKKTESSKKRPGMNQTFFFVFLFLFISVFCFSSFLEAGTKGKLKTAWSQNSKNHADGTGRDWCRRIPACNPWHAKG